MARQAVRNCLILHSDERGATYAVEHIKVVISLKALPFGVLGLQRADTAVKDTASVYTASESFLVKPQRVYRRRGASGNSRLSAAGNYVSVLYPVGYQYLDRAVSLDLLTEFALLHFKVGANCPCQVFHLAP